MENLEQNLNIDTKKSKKKKIVLVVLICIVVLGIVSASWAFLIQPKFFPTIYWRTYKSEKNGFLVKYPRDYQFGTETRTDFDREYAPFFAQIEREIFSLKKEMGRSTIRISVYGNPERLSPREWNRWASKNDDRMLGVEHEEKDSNLDSFKDTTVNGLSAIDFSFEEPVASDILIRTTMILVKNDKAFNISYTKHNASLNNKNDKTVFDLFLKSLQID